VSAKVAPPSAALVVAADEEMRILLRGLLQLHRVRVDAEADGMTEALRLVRDRRPGIVVADSHLSEGSVGGLVAGARQVCPGLRFILVVPASRPPPQLEPEAMPDVMLLKPFRIQQFADAILPPQPPGTAG